MKKILLILIISAATLLADFSRDANGIVTDSETGLMWQDNKIGTTTTWERAVDRCEVLTLGSHTDWRLASLEELTSIVKDDRTNPSIDPVFQHTAPGSYWSATSYAKGDTFAWFVKFYAGRKATSNKANTFYVRCVRAGK